MSSRSGSTSEIASPWSTRLYACDHHKLDDAFFVRMHEVFTDSEIVDLAVSPDDSSPSAG